MKKLLSTILFTFSFLASFSYDLQLLPANVDYYHFGSTSIPFRICEADSTDRFIIVVDVADSALAGDSITLHMEMEDPLGGSYYHTIGWRLLTNTYYTTWVEQPYIDSIGFDLSKNGVYSLKVYHDYFRDNNRSNDTVKTTFVINTPTIGGTVGGDVTVCVGQDSVPLELEAYFGDSIDWQFSLDSGSNWTYFSYGDDNPNFAVVSTLMNDTFLVRARVRNGVCVADTSDIAYFINFDSASVGGILSGIDTVCAQGNAGAVNLSGETGTIGPWWYSEDTGTTWMSIASGLNSLPYNNIITTTLYRAEVTNGTCDSTYSNQIQIVVDDTSEGGVPAGVGDICPSTIGTISASNTIGQVLYWVWRQGAGVWDTIAGSTVPYIGKNWLSNDYEFRAIVKNGTCGIDSSTAGYMQNTLDSPSVGGHLVSDLGRICADGSADVQIDNQGGLGTLMDWLYSTDSAQTWIVVDSAANGMNSVTVSGLSTTTLFRVETKNGGCPITYSDTIEILVDSVSVAGDLIAPVLGACAYDNQGAVLVQEYRGEPVNWLYSYNGGQSWTATGDTTVVITYADLPDTTLFRVAVANGVCIADTSLPATVAIWALPYVNAGADFEIHLGDTVDMEPTQYSGVSFQWTPENLFEDAEELYAITFPIRTSVLYLEITDEHDCKNSDSVTVTIPEELDYTLVPSNLVTANDDGKNEYWFVENIQFYETNMISIFDKQGNQVYQKDYYRNDWLPGGETNPIEEGTYIYYIHFSDTDTEYKGSLTIVK